MTLIRTGAPMGAANRVRIGDPDDAGACRFFLFISFLLLFHSRVFIHLFIQKIHHQLCGRNLWCSKLLYHRLLVFRAGICKVLSEVLHCIFVITLRKFFQILLQLFQSIPDSSSFFPPLDDVVDGVTVGLPFALQIHHLCFSLLL